MAVAWPAAVIHNAMAITKESIMQPYDIDPYWLLGEHDESRPSDVIPYNEKLLESIVTGKVPVR
jgi:hypothetical protein